MKSGPNMNKWKDWRIGALNAIEEAQLVTEGKKKKDLDVELKVVEEDEIETPEQPLSIPGAKEEVKKIGEFQFAFKDDTISFKNTNCFTYDTLKKVCAAYEAWLEKEEKSIEKTKNAQKLNKETAKKHKE